MTVCRQKQAEMDLGGMFPALRVAVKEAVKWFWESHAEDLHWMEHRTRANLIRDRVANVELPRALLGHEGVRDIEDNQVKLFVIEVNRHIYSIKVKQMDELGTISPGKTQLSLDYNDNQLELDGIPHKAAALHLGAVHNIARRDDPEILLACANGDEPAWVIRLADEAPPPVTELIPRTSRDDGDRRVRVRRTAREKTSR
jgi:hypothetical protein